MTALQETGLIHAQLKAVEILLDKSKEAELLGRPVRALFPPELLA